ncbi:hypothetical protein OVS_03810 [Mycoplasma ovis str. Michigan]|uniref:Chromosome partition protein Smc n=1 Tax=Mycoplasma ovis str. Michigan TaxID=1415773 RepID=A0ABM5P289_9MOLU|nr:hypothetical protein [Mycoplasma ovis]AHC40494.1 hypothetical protein OVS_03810 [Mycoplasma ovis str. Michigan]
MAILKALSLGLSGVLAGGAVIGIGGKVLLGSNQTVVTNSSDELSDPTEELEETTYTITQLKTELNELTKQQSDKRSEYDRDLASKQEELGRLRGLTKGFDETKEQLKTLRGEGSQDSENEWNSKIKQQKTELERIQQDKRASLEAKNQAEKYNRESSTRLEQMKRFEKVFNEFLEENISEDQIKDVEQYKERLSSIALQRKGKIDNFYKSISENLEKLIRDLRTGREVKVTETDAQWDRLYLPGYTWKLPIVGSPQEEEEFIKTLKDIFEKLKK